MWSPVAGSQSSIHHSGRKAPRLQAIRTDVVNLTLWVDRQGSSPAHWQVQQATRPNKVKPMTVTTYQQVIDAALAYRDSWRARKALRNQFRQEPGVDQVFLKATAAQLDKNVTDSRRNLERTAIRLQNDLSEQRRSSKNTK
jgi:hypothetical protein